MYVKVSPPMDPPQIPEILQKEQKLLIFSSTGPEIKGKKVKENV